MDLFLNALKWSAVVGAAALVLALARPRLERRYSARWRYWTWLVLAALLLLAPLPWRELLPQRIAPPSPPVVVQLPAPELTFGERPAEDPEAVLPTPPPTAESAPTEPAPAPENAPAPGPGGVTLSPEEVVPALWAVGAAMFALYHLAGTLWLSRRARRWSRPAGAETAAAYAALAGEMGIQAPPPLLVSSAVGSPMVLGLLRPRLLLPEEGFSGEELRFILRHELTHFRRRDLWYKLLLLAANAVHWFNPLVYLLRRTAEADLELTCDDAVVAGSGGEMRRAYSETLLKSLHRTGALGRSALSTHFYGGARGMKERFRNILNGGGRKWGWALLAAALTATVAAALVWGFRYDGHAISEAERAEWEAKLNTPEWNSYVRYMYTDVRDYDPTRQLMDFCCQSWPESWEKATPPAEALADQPENTVPIFLTTAQVEEFLLAHTGYALADFPGGFGPDVTYFPDRDGYFYWQYKNDIVEKVTVTGGKRRGDTLQLEVETDPLYRNPSSLDRGTLTLEDGKIRSFTNDAHTRAERLARQVMAERVRWVESTGVRVDRSYLYNLYLPDLYSARSPYTMPIRTVDGKTYQLWSLHYALHPDDVERALAGLASQQARFSFQVKGQWLLNPFWNETLILREDGEKLTYVGCVPSDYVRNTGYTWEGYISALEQGLPDAPARPLADGELAAWQETLNTPAYAPYTARMYIDVRNLPPEEVRAADPAVTVTVTGGTIQGDQVTLELELGEANQSGMTSGAMTLVNGQVLSFTNPLHTEAERMADGKLCQTVLDLHTAGAMVKEAYLSELRLMEQFPVEDLTYYRFHVAYRIHPEDPASCPIPDGMAMEDGRLVNDEFTFGGTVLLLGMDGEGNFRRTTHTFYGFELYGQLYAPDGGTWADYVDNTIVIPLQLD